MNFVTFDFETATSERSSACQIGFTFVKDGEIESSKSYLIKPPQFPYFDEFNISIHGITPNDVKDSPYINELWDELKPIFQDNFIIAHNAGFDMSVLRHSLDHFNIDYPLCNYGCTYIFSKKVWPEALSFGLADLSNQFNIELNHHDAESDSRATAKLAKNILDTVGVNDFNKITEKIEVRLGELFPEGYHPCGSIYKRTYSPKEKIVGNPELFNQDSFFYGKNVVFTGKLTSMLRTEAQQLIADIGGNNQRGVTSTTNVLVMGQQDFRQLGDSNMSKKQMKAYDLRKSGVDIEIISENQFLEFL
ncbi:exonuclease domain-containing protein [Marivirga sp.]|uniref:exonuclease domain-containing protein n=1 Tax=Marivirga sp. TaxID=2018662 RepID=UPI003DA715F7